MPRPRIGVTPEGRDAQGAFIAPNEYLSAVRRAGGLPVVILPWAEDAAEQMAFLDGLLLAGGGDVDPALYNGAAHPAIYEVDRERDEGEIALAKLAFARQTPTLGICRGAQIINVALGGSLVEHLPDEVNGDVLHRSDPPGPVEHIVCIAHGSLLATVMQADVVPVASWHHQSIRAVGNRLAAVAHAADGTVEAVEASGHPWFVAVQWHPELTAIRDPLQQRIFDAFVAAASRAQSA